MDQKSPSLPPELKYDGKEEENEQGIIRLPWRRMIMCPSKRIDSLRYKNGERRFLETDTEFFFYFF